MAYSKEFLRKAAEDALRWYLPRTLKDICGDYRAGGIMGSLNLSYSIGNLTTTTPENPSGKMLIRSVGNSKPIAIFLVEDLYRTITK